MRLPTGARTISIRSLMVVLIVGAPAHAEELELGNPCPINFSALSNSQTLESQMLTQFGIEIAIGVLTRGAGRSAARRWGKEAGESTEDWLSFTADVGKASGEIYDKHNKREPTKPLYQPGKGLMSIEEAMQLHAATQCGP